MLVQHRLQHFLQGGRVGQCIEVDLHRAMMTDAAGRTRTQELQTLLPWNWTTTNATPEAKPLAA